MLNDCPFQISCHPDLESAIDRYCEILRAHLDIRQMKDDPSIPDWLGDIKVFVAFEMWRSDGEILNDFSHVVSFCQDIEKLGIQGGVAVNLLGFQGPFDSRYPYFDPALELGGPTGLREASEAIRAGRNRLRMHFNVWGMDPYLEDFEEMEHLAMPYDRVYERIPTGQIGPYDGWPGAYPAVRADYDTGWVKMIPVESGETFIVFETPEIPQPMEGFLTIYNVGSPSSGRLRAEVGNRQVKSLPGEPEHSNRVRFRFRFRFDSGRNRIRLDYIGGKPDLSRALFRIDRTITSGGVWSYPIVRADIHHPEWIKITRDNMVKVCREYRIDIPYIDAVNIWRAEDSPSFRGMGDFPHIFETIRKDLPGRAFGCEYPAELGYNMFRLTGTAFKCPPDYSAPVVLMFLSADLTVNWVLWRLWTKSRESSLSVIRVSAVCWESSRGCA
jgi:hypothetical protein